MRSILVGLVLCSFLSLGLSSAGAEKLRAIKITLKAKPDGGLREVILDGVVIQPSKDGKQTRMQVLNAKVAEILIDPMGKRRAGDFEAVIYADDGLMYEHIVETVGAVSGRKHGKDGQHEELVKKVRFSHDDPNAIAPKAAETK